MNDQERVEFLCAAAAVLEQLHAEAADARLITTVSRYSSMVCFRVKRIPHFWDYLEDQGLALDPAYMLGDVLGFSNTLQAVEHMQKDLPYLDKPRRCCFGGFAKLKNVTSDTQRMAREHLRSGDSALLYPLSDSLEEVGYDVALAEHLRSEEHHCHGCWVIDAVLNLRPSMVTTKRVMR